MQNLISELPEEIVMEFLIRVHHVTFPLLRRVCRRWKQAVESPLFHLLRRSSFSRHLIILSQAVPAVSPAAVGPALKYSSSFPSFRLAVLDPSSAEWATLPCLPHGLPLFCGLATSGPHLIVIGGWDPDTWTPSDAVYVFSFVSGAWHRGHPIPGPRRSFFACAASPTGHVFVAGGHDEEKNALRSAMVYDVAKDEWAALPEMARERDECAGVFDFKEGLFRVAGGYCTAMQGRFGRSAEAFDVGSWRWRSLEEEAVEDGEYSRTCVVGVDWRIYMCGGGGKVVVVKDGQGWRKVADVPEDVRVAPRMVSWGRELVVVGSGSSGGVQAVFIMEMKEGAAVAWRRVEMPKEYSGYIQGGCCIEI